jgi:hypothetical protein
MWWVCSVLALPLQKQFKIIWFPKIEFVYLPYKEIKVMKNIVLHLLASIGAFGLAVLTMQGVTQQFIHFADPINEMAVCVLALMGGVAAMFGVVEGIKEQFK